MSFDENAELLARALRLKAEWHRAQAAGYTLDATAAEAAAQMHRFARQLTASERREIAEHPDLAELNVQLDGYYGSEGPK